MKKHIATTSTSNDDLELQALKYCLDYSIKHIALLEQKLYHEKVLLSIIKSRISAHNHSKTKIK